MKPALAALCMCVLFACGGDPDVPDPGDGGDNRVISPAFAGEWSGSATLYVGEAPQGERPVTVSVSVEVDGPTLDVNIGSACGVNTIYLSTTGNGRSTMWYGDVVCPAPTDTCLSRSVGFRSAILRVLEDGRFYALLNGTATGCGRSEDAKVELYAER